MDNELGSKVFHVRMEKDLCDLLDKHNNKSLVIKNALRFYLNNKADTKPMALLVAQIENNPEYEIIIRKK